MAIIYVDINATGANDGTSWEDAYTDELTGIEAASGGDEVRVAKGNYTTTSQIDVPAGVKVSGGWSGESSESERDLITNITRIYSNGLLNYILKLYGSNTIQDISFINADIYCIYSTGVDSITLSNLKFWGVNNSSISITNCTTLNVRKCIFSNKHYGAANSQGNAVYLNGVTTFNIDRCQIINQGKLTYKRAIHIYNSSGNIINNFFINNKYTGDGSCINLDTSDVNIYHNTFYKNSLSDNLINLVDSENYNLANNIFVENTTDEYLIYWDSQASYGVFANNCVYNNTCGVGDFRVHLSTYSNITALEVLSWASNNIETDPSMVIELTSTLTNVDFNSDGAITFSDSANDLSNFVGYVIFDTDTNEAYYIESASVDSVIGLGTENSSSIGNNYIIVSFRYDSDSSCIDSADNTYLTSVDILDTSRIADEGDIGCFEYVAETITCFMCEPLPKYSFSEKIAYLVETQQNIENEEQRILLSSKANRIVTLNYRYFTEDQKSEWLTFLETVVGKKESFVFNHPVSGLTYNAKLETNGLKFKHYVNYLYQFGTIKIKLLDCIDTDIADVTTFPDLNNKMRGYTYKESFYNSEKKFNNGNISVVNIKKELNLIEISLVNLSFTQLNSLLGFYNYCKGLFKSFTFYNKYEGDKGYTARFNDSFTYQNVSYKSFDCKIEIMLLEEL